jgi:hypothetical protein
MRLAQGTTMARTFYAAKRSTLSGLPRSDLAFAMTLT